MESHGSYGNNLFKSGGLLSQNTFNSYIWSQVPPPGRAHQTLFTRPTYSENVRDCLLLSWMGFSDSAHHHRRFSMHSVHRPPYVSFITLI